MKEHNFSREGSKEQFEKFKQLPDNVLADAYMMIKNGHEATFMDSYVNEKPYADRVRKLLDSGSLDFFTSTPLKWVYKFFAYLEFQANGVFEETSEPESPGHPLTAEEWLSKRYPELSYVSKEGAKLMESYAQHVINCVRSGEQASYPSDWVRENFDLLKKICPETMSSPAVPLLWEVMREYAGYRHDLFNQQNRGGMPTPTFSNHSGEEEEEEIIDSFIQFLLDDMAPFARESLKWSYFAKKEEFLNRR